MTSSARRASRARLECEWRERKPGTYAGHIGTCTDITEHKQREIAGVQVQNNLLLGQEAERQRVARELHDDIGQHVALLAVSLEEVRRLVAPAAPQLEEKLSSLQRQVERIASDVHRISHNLHPATVAQLGLVPALRRLCREFSDRMQISVDFVDDGGSRRLPEEVAVALFRVSQECLANVAKHSKSPRHASLCKKRPMSYA